jgi:hypothetical protein
LATRAGASSQPRNPREDSIPEVDFGEIASWGLIVGTFAFVAAQRFGVGPAVAAGMLAAFTTKAALLGLT